MSLKEKNQKESITKNQINTLKQQRTFVPKTKWKWNFDMEIQRIDVSKSPFTLIRHEEEIFITLGRNILSERYKIGEEVELLKEWEKPNWDSIMRVIGVLIEINEEYNNNLNKE